MGTPDHLARKRDGPEPPADLFPEVTPEREGFEKRPSHERSDPGIRDGWCPRVDIAEAAGEYVFFVEVPGVVEGGITVEVAGGFLSIFADKAIPEAMQSHIFHKVERDFGASFRSFEIPSDASGGTLEWSLDDGILVIRLKRLGGIHSKGMGNDTGSPEGRERELPSGSGESAGTQNPSEPRRDPIP